MSKVSLSTCDVYDVTVLKKVIAESVVRLGGWTPYVLPGEKVLLKVNLVSNKAPETASTTHPAFVQAVAELLIEHGAQVVIGDSPGGLFNEDMLRRVYHGTGMMEAAQNSGAALNYNTGTLEKSFPEGKRLHSITQTAMLADADKVISLSKLKTHGMMVYTGAVKNQFGTVPGTKKAEYHFSMPKAEDFADALIDICLAASPVLYLMDAVVAMEGNGPTGGDPRQVGAVLASADPFALDLCAAHMIGLERAAVPVLEQGYLRGLCPEHYSQVEIVGENIESLVISDFRMPDHVDANLAHRFGKAFEWLSDRLRPKVQIRPEICIGCRTCFSNCPAGAMTMVDKTVRLTDKTGENKKVVRKIPTVDYSRCIRCYCCQELCPKNAIVIKEALIMKLVNQM